MVTKRDIPWPKPGDVMNRLSDSFVLTAAVSQPLNKRLSPWRLP